MRRNIRAPVDIARDAHARRDAGVKAFLDMTPAQIDAWIKTADVREILGTLAKAIAVRDRRGGA